MSDTKSKMLKSLVDLRRSKKERTAIESSESEPYPYGTRINFDQEEVAKLGIESLKAGQQVDLVATGTVTSVNVREEENGKKSHDISIQIKKAKINSHKE